ncbi:putative Type 4 fimbrial assembly protein PilC [Candidatus Zixiibacteriota bacterium]|nr:putative Type 4 fimbrial assembly protein PilC [candidate division Zixibacteria bacterium]
MTTYRYQGRNLTGEKITGLRKAGTPEDLEIKLAEEGLFLESCHTQDNSIFAGLTGWLKRSEITRLTRQMAVLISSGITILEALESTREQTNDKSIINIFDNIITSVQAGEPLYLAFGKHPAYFDSIYLSLLETGEMSGTLDISLERIASYRERSERVNKKIKSALAYPALVLLVSVIVVFTLVAYIIPIFSSMYAGFGMELPSLTQKVVGISEILRETAWMIPVIMIVLLISAGFLLRSHNFRKTLGRVVLHLPVFKNLAVKLAASRFCRTLGTLLNSGLPLIEAVPVASRTVGNRYIENRLESMTSRLGDGATLAETLDEAMIFPRTVIRMTAAGESTGRLGEMFAKTADFYESEVDTEITTLTSLIEPIVIIGLGVIIAVILVAMYLPLFDLVGQLGV